MTDLLASLPPKPLPAHAPAGNMRGFEDDHVVTGDFGQASSSDDAGLTFGEFLDIVNPLHHIPVVSTIYRAITGDQISPESRFFGGMLFGGPGGAIAAGVASLFEEASGGDLGQHLAELVNDLTGGGDDQDGAPNIAAAKASTATGPLAAVEAMAQTGANTVQPAALAGAEIMPAAVHLNRIAYNPKAAFGVHQHLAKNHVPASQTPAAANAFPARTLALPFGAPKTADPESADARAPDLLPAVFRTSDGGPAQSPRKPAGSAAGGETIQAPQVSNAVNRSQRQQADLMLAQWAAQEMARQNHAAVAPGETENTGGTDTPAAAPVKAPAHPMLAPRDASPEWYVQAMDQALSRYRNGASTVAVGTPAISVRR
mgnify:CR=1 FL=1